MSYETKYKYENDRLYRYMKDINANIEIEISNLRIPGLTPLMLDILNQNEIKEENLKYLFCKDEFGSTVLTYTSETKHLQFFLENGLDKEVNTPIIGPSENTTLLHLKMAPLKYYSVVSFKTEHAVKTENMVLDNIELLLKYGADPTIEHEKFKSALFVAKEEGHSKIVQLFEFYINKRKVQKIFPLLLCGLKDKESYLNMLNKDVMYEIYKQSVGEIKDF